MVELIQINLAVGVKRELLYQHHLAGNQLF